MKPIFFTIAFCSIICLSCSTKIYLNETPRNPTSQYDSLVILRNPVSAVIPVARYPKYKDVKYHVKGVMHAIERIDSMLYVGLIENNIPCIMQDSIEVFDKNTLYLVYQDYWAWDLKKYMHVLWIGVYDYEENQLFEVASEGNTAGIHDFPTPQKQVPLMVQKLAAKLPEYIEVKKPN